MALSFFRKVLPVVLLTIPEVLAYSSQDRPHYRNQWMHAANPDPVVDVVQANATFEQLIDHSNPSLGTFPQFYFYSTEFYEGPGSPIVFFTPGEVNVTGYPSYLHINRTTGVIAQRLGAAVIILEHRYWGTSTPFADLTTENLQYLTLENSIKDVTYFAKNADLPFDTEGKSKPDKAPWIFSGGSYSGALAAWTESVDPGTFWAYHSSSAPVEVISDYWGYFLPVQEGMPKNCSKDISLVIDYIDGIGHNGTEEQKTNLKAMFGLEDVEHFDDFASALENGPWLWQGNQFYTNSGFFDFCDAVENVKPNSTLPGAGGVGLEAALAGYADWFNTTMLPDFCQGYGYEEFKGTRNTLCFDTYNASSPLYTDTSLANTAGRQWTWFLCNQPLGYWQNGAPSDRPSIVSRYVNNAYWERQCGLYFPPVDGHTYGLAEGKTYDDVNKYTGGWDITNTTRLVYVNGDFDPWREGTVSSELRPGGPLKSTPQTPVNIVPGGFHTSDLITQNGRVNASVQAVIDATVEQLVKWTAEFPGSGNATLHSRKWRG